MSAVSAAETTQDTENRRRLGEAVRARRLELGTSVRAAAAQTGVARDTWIGLEEATRRTAETNYAAIEKTLQWAPGSIVAILSGEVPSIASVKLAFNDALMDVDVVPAFPTGSMSHSTAIRPASDHPGDAALIRVMRNPDLTDEEKARIVRTVISDQERYAEQRANELIQQALKGD